jgi:MFS family permease
MCYNQTTSSYYPCGAAKWCTNLNDTDMKTSKNSVNYAAANTNIYNWFVKLEIPCKPKPKHAVGLIAVIALVSTSISCLIFPRLGDIYGRKPVYLFALTL